MRIGDQIEIDGVTYTVASPYVGIDERKLSITDRLGLAYCRLNSYEWDDLLAGEPATDTNTCCRKMMAIQEIIGEANTSRCWWKFNLGRTEDEWREWYYNNFLGYAEGVADAQVKPKENGTTDSTQA